MVLRNLLRLLLILDQGRAERRQKLIAVQAPQPRLDVQQRRGLPSDASAHC